MLVITVHLGCLQKTEGQKIAGTVETVQSFLVWDTVGHCRVGRRVLVGMMRSWLVEMVVGNASCIPRGEF